MAKLFSEQLRSAIEESGMTRYQISLISGIAQSQLSKFMHRERGLSLESIDRLMGVLKLEIRPKRRREK
jgi:transcriptional regulator with XRE-family HTH domain